MDDLRRAERLLVDLPVRCRGPSLSVDGRAFNLSQHGLFISGRDLSADRRYRLELDLPDEEQPLVSDVEVRFSHEEGAGLQFVELPPHGKRRIANFLIRRVTWR